jgi:hypothetical protein
MNTFRLKAIRLLASDEDGAGVKPRDIVQLCDEVARLTAELAAAQAQLAQVDDYGMYCYDYGADGNTWRMSFDEWLTKRNEPVAKGW